MTIAVLKANVRAARKLFLFGTDGAWYWFQTDEDDGAQWWEKLTRDTATTTTEVVYSLKAELRTGWPATLDIVCELARNPVDPVSLCMVPMVPKAAEIGTPSPES